MDYIILGIIYPYLGMEDHITITSFHDLLREMNYSMIPYSMLLIMASGYFHNKISIVKLNEANQKELSLMEKELSFYKTQFTSHVMFNFLNYIYSGVFGKSERITNAILNFSEMLKYIVDLNPGKKINLEHEISYIQHYINLQKVITDIVCVKFTYDNYKKKKEIYPFILITFVENAFKHGVFRDPADPIEIKLVSTNSFLEFSVRNKIENYKLPSSKKGIPISKKFLDQLYANKHHLKIENSNDFYFVKLKIYD